MTAERHAERNEFDARWGEIISSVPVMIWVVGRSGARFFNACWSEFTGQALQEELGMGWLGGVHPDDAESVAATFEQRFAEPADLELEFRLRNADGSYRWVSAWGVPQLAADQHLCEYVGAAIDITDRRLLENERHALLGEANEAAARLAKLQELTARLVSLTRPEEVAEVVLGQGVAELGGTSGSLCLLAPDGCHLVVAAQAGYSDEVTSSWGRFPLDAPTPAGDAVRAGKAIYITTLSELHHRYPIFGGRPIVGDEALAVLPLTTADRGCMGAMVIGFAQTREFPPGDRRLLSALAAQAANALARAQSRAALEAAREQLAYLADASGRLGASLDLSETLATVASLAVPRLADRCSLYLLAGGRVETFVLEPADPGVDIKTFLEHYPVDLNEGRGVGAVLRTGQAEFLPEIDEAMLAEGGAGSDRHELLRRIGFGAVLILPLRARGVMLGALALSNRSERRMTVHERNLADELAARASAAIDNARLFTRQTEVARRLQSSLLPPALPAIDGLDLAARLTSAGEGIDVGGDFYDCTPCGPDRWMVVVGDVKGKGLDAAALTGLARHTIRATAITGAGPATVLAVLNEVLVHHEAEGRSFRRDDDWEAAEPRFCTVVAVELRRAGPRFEATVACGGHPLPLVRDPAHRVAPLGRPGALLGVEPSVELQEMFAVLAPGSVLVCFTDGVSECHDGACFFDVDRIAAVLAGATGTASEIAHTIERSALEFTAGKLIRDDMAIVVARIL